MSVSTKQIKEFNTTTAFGEESSDPDYLAWRDAKVSAALADVKAHPENRIPQSEVWKKFGLES